MIVQPLVLAVRLPVLPYFPTFNSSPAYFILSLSYVMILDLTFGNLTRKIWYALIWFLRGSNTVYVIWVNLFSVSSLVYKQVRSAVWINDRSLFDFYEQDHIYVTFLNFVWNIFYWKISRRVSLIFWWILKFIVLEFVPTNFNCVLQISAHFFSSCW